ncbi:Mobile element protein [Deinococcus marmoris]|uniref:Mobile element protein n=1 Tax=Deinococcus marmoris TaxID=249408 RepID=A0A1U7NY58_9DEIO|nr:Mobile element protein [Deinococcus marmoris]
MSLYLTSHFPEYRKNQIELLSLLVLALIGAKDIRHAALAERCGGNAWAASVIRKIERFFDRHPLCPLDVARLVLTLLPDAKKREFAIDRTNWKLGRTDVNVLFLAVIWRGVAVPLLFELLPHSGNSDTSTRLTLLDSTLTLLDCWEVATIYADQEFIGQAWIQGLAERGLPITVRLRVDARIDGLPAGEWLEGLQPDEKAMLIDNAEVYGLPMNVVLTRTDQGEALIVASNATKGQHILKGYRQRWKIECLFRALKTKGFNLENTHMTLPAHVTRLLCLLILGYVWSVLVGIDQEAALKKHGRRAWSVISLGLRSLVRACSRQIGDSAEDLLNLIQLWMPPQRTA